MENVNSDVGMIGLGVMTCNLVLLNMADHSYSVVGYDRDAGKGTSLRGQAGGRPIQVADNLNDLTHRLRPPRTVMIMVPAGAPVDAVIHELMDLLSPGDILIDGGNSFYKDTNLRARILAEKGIQYLGVGISGGEDGARHGPSLMPGGPLQAYQRVQPVFEAIAARANNEPSVTYPHRFSELCSRNSGTRSVRGPDCT
jgi:6-phosphogluconate dehydrogenase